MRRVLAVLVVVGAAGITVSASARTLHTLVSVSNSGGGTVTSDPSGSGCAGSPVICTNGGINCGSTCSSQFKQGTTVTLNQSPNPGGTFVGWGGKCSGTGSCRFTIPPDGGPTIAVSATFSPSGGGGGGGPPPPPPPPTRFRLTVQKGGTGAGTVVSDPAGIDCGPTCSMTSDNGQLIRLTATASPGSVFKGWGGGCTGMTCTPTLFRDLTITASFDSVNDTAAPRVVAFATTVKRGKKGKLSYFVSDDSGRSRERVTVYNGRKILARLGTALHVAKAGTVRSVVWKVPRTAATGRRKFCVTATDPVGNKSAPRCARLTITH